VLVLLLQYTDNKVLCGRYERVTRMYLPQASVENEYREPPKTCLQYLSSQDQGKLLINVFMYCITFRAVSLDTWISFVYGAYDEINIVAVESV